MSSDREGATPKYRTLGVQAGVAALACVGVWNFLVRPLDAGTHGNESALKRASAEVAALEASSSQLHELDGIEQSLETEREVMYRSVALASESGKIYERLRREAAQAGVTIQSIEPATGRQGGRASALQPNEPRAESFGYGLEVTGGYDAIGRFIDACERGLGAAKVAKFRISPTGTTPDGQQPVLRATVEVLLVKLTPPSDRPERSSR